MGEQLERTVEVVGELRQVLVEGRALLKDLQRERKACEQTIANSREAVEQLAADHVEQMLEPWLADQFEQMKADIVEQRERIQARIDRSFHEYWNILRFGNAQGRGDDALAQSASVGHCRLLAGLPTDGPTDGGGARA